MKNTISEMYPSRIFEDYIVPYLEADYNEFEWLGAGEFAVAYRYGNEVCKLTTDYTDAIVANELLGKNFLHFAKVYDVVKCVLPFRTVDNYYLIITEYLTPINQTHYAKIKPILSFSNIKHSFVNEAEQLGFNNHNDFHFHNVGVNAYGTWKVFDFGDNSLLSAKPLKHISL